MFVPNDSLLAQRGVLILKRVRAGISNQQSPPRERAMAQLQALLLTDLRKMCCVTRLTRNEPQIEFASQKSPVSCMLQRSILQSGYCIFRAWCSNTTNGERTPDRTYMEVYITLTAMERNPWHSRLRFWLRRTA